MKGVHFGYLAPLMGSPKITTVRGQSLLMAPELQHGFNNVLFVVLFCFLGLHLQLMEVPRLGANSTATAT